MITVRLAGRDDSETVGRLLHAVDVHYWSVAAPLADFVRHVRERVLPSGCEIALAEAEGVPLGLATFAVLYPAPELGGVLFLKDLFTVAEARGRGVGHALMESLAELARARGCVRFDWTAETDNPDALAFYDRLGAKRVPEKVYFRFDLRRGEGPLPR